MRQTRHRSLIAQRCNSRYRVWLCAVATVLCAASQLHAHSPEFLYNAPLSLGISYDYTAQTRGRQITGTLTASQLRRETGSGSVDFRILGISIGQLTDSAGTKTLRWELHCISVNIDKYRWLFLADSSAGQYIRSMEKTPARGIGVGITGGATFLDIDCTQQADRLQHWVQLRAGVFARTRWGVHIDMRVVPAIGLTSYRLGNQAYGALGLNVSHSYTGLEAGATGTLRCYYRGISMALQAESSNIFAEKTVHSLSVGAKAAVVLPSLPILRSWMLTAEATRSQTYFDNNMVVLGHISMGLSVPLTNSYNPW